MDEKNQDSIGYEFKSKIMICSVVVLFVACFIIVVFHVYKRWFCRRHIHNHHHFHHRDATTSAAVIVAVSGGLDIKAVKSLPTFVYESKNCESPAPECAVCLSEFEENESGRILPECNHCFHIECIDMWLLSHCDCPLCRTRVRVQPGGNPKHVTAHVAINVSGNMNSGSGYCLNPDESEMGSCSSSPTIPDKIEGDPDPNSNLGSDIESGSNTPASSVWVLKRLLI